MIMAELGRSTPHRCNKNLFYHYRDVSMPNKNNGLFKLSTIFLAMLPALLSGLNRLC